MQTYNSLSHRVLKTLANSSKETYHFDEAGHLITVTDQAGVTLRDYIYWGDQQIALISNGTTYYIHNDHLNTPQVITNQSQQVVWMGDYEPFGKVASNANNSIEIFSRFPGQYLDNETGLYYNYFRDYDPSIGRYIESDPIGLEGGINTYGYVDGNPIVYSDTLGLQKSGTRNARVIRQENAAYRALQSLRDRIRNLQEKAENGAQSATSVSDAIEEAQQQIDDVYDNIQRVCVARHCPWDNPLPLPAPADFCPASVPELPKFEPLRTKENGCRCIEYRNKLDI